MNIIQIGILLQLIGTIFVILVAGVFLAPEITGRRVPNYIIRALTRFASRLQDLVPQQSIARIKKVSRKISRFVLLGLTLWLLVSLSTVFLASASYYGSTLLLALGVITGALGGLLIAWATFLPAFSLKATKQSGTWDKGKFTPTEEAYPIKISLLYRLKFAFLPFVAILLISYLWPLLLLVLLVFALAFVWRSVMQFLATQKAPRIIALFIGFGVLLAGLIIELISTF